MVIENAFWKLPEFLTSNFIHTETFEATVVHLFSVAILMELNARNIPRYFQHVATEKPYPTKGLNDRPIHADIFVNLNEAYPGHGYIDSYGTRYQNWIEAKAFLSTVRKRSAPPLTENVGRIIRDLLRICIFPEELQGKIRQNGRYLLLIFSDSPSKSLAMSTNTQKRLWLSNLLSEGYCSMHLKLTDEPKVLRQAVGPGFIDTPDLTIDVKFRTMVFRPDENAQARFWGYLIRIQYFRISFQNLEIQFEDNPEDHWDKERIGRLKLMQREILRRL